MTVTISIYKKSVLVLILLLPILSYGQTSKQDSIWKPFQCFIGDWTGKGGGEPGEGTYERSYKFIFNKKYIEVKNKSVYPPTKDNPNGEIHEDIGYISFDKTRNIFVLRQFHKEGFVNQYKQDTISTDGKRIVFISEAIENIKTGWRAKETYQIFGDSEISETFELAPPQKDFEIYSKVLLKKKNQ
ncbi:MAG: hypothetical protein WC209_08310 [Ignavibacteriaceae bacterium]|jgi:hypothetical protein